MFYFLTSLFFCLLTIAEGTTALSDSKKINLYSTQDIDGCFNVNFHTLSFIAHFPEFGAEADKINDAIAKTLEPFGTINRKKVFVQTKNGEAADLSGFSAEAMLIYQIKDLSDINNSELGVMRASLDLSSMVHVKNSTERAYIWSCNCFVKGNTKKDLEKTVSDTLNVLLQQFNENYSKANQPKPIFNFVIS
jgi:hypothetical protein